MYVNPVLNNSSRCPWPKGCPVRRNQSFQTPHCWVDVGGDLVLPIFAVNLPSCRKSTQNGWTKTSFLITLDHNFCIKKKKSLWAVFWHWTSGSGNQGLPPPSPIRSFLVLQVLWTAKEKMNKHPIFKVFYVHFMQSLGRNSLPTCQKLNIASFMKVAYSN